MRFRNTLGGLFKLLEKINRGNGIVEKVQFKENITVIRRRGNKVKRLTA